MQKTSFHFRLQKHHIVVLFIVIGVAIGLIQSYTLDQKIIEHKQVLIQQLIEAQKKLEKLNQDQNLTIQQKDSEKASMQSQIDGLNNQLQAKRQIPAYSGYGGVVGPIYSGNDYAPGNCTFGVASWRSVPSGMGNANQWDDYAYSHNITVSSVPIANSVAQTDAGYYGHVALVESIQGGQVLIKEENALGFGVISERWADVSEFKYLYF